jgi:hypothetical protein
MKHTGNPRPNILFILADDHGCDDLSVHGGPRVWTPHLDQLAREGLRFTHIYANLPVCSPSRAAPGTVRFWRWGLGRLRSARGLDERRGTRGRVVPALTGS